MIQKPNSSQLMDEFRQVQEDIAAIRTDLQNTEEQINTKLSILNMYHMIAQNSALQVQNGSRKENSIYFVLDAANKIVGGQYDIYGQTIHSPFKAIPEQMFNFITESGPLYKDCASVYFNDKYKYDYCNILKHEADPTKTDVYEKFTGEDLTIRVKLNHTNFYGNTACNMIEICPYFAGTFDIERINIYSLAQYMAEGENMESVDVQNGGAVLTKENEMGNIIPYVKDVGACRILLPDTYQIYQIDFKIKIHQCDDGYPFGLRHLYFYNAKIDTKNDYIITLIEKDDYINSVGRNVTIGTPTGEITAQAKLFGIEYYMTFDNGMLQNQIEFDDSLSRNIKRIYAKIPLFDCLTHVIFHDIEVR